MEGCLKANISQSERFSEFAVNFKLENVPLSIIQYARLLVLDLTGCAIGALQSDEAQAAQAACLAMDGGQGRVSMWGSGQKVSVKSAALFNGIISHVLELDDFLGIDHTGAVVIPTLFALMEDLDSFDETLFLESLILAYEIGRRMLDTAGGYRQHNKTGWHTTGSLGTFVAAVAAAKYMKLTQDEMVSAIGLAGSFTGGTWAFNTDGSMSKRFHPGKAAESGLTAAYMARAGFTGPKWIMEAEWGGYFSNYASNHDYNLDTLFTGLGEDLRIGWTGIKPYACCRGNHSSIDAIYKLRKEAALSSEQIETITVRCTMGQHRQLGNGSPNTGVEAQLSLPFAIALALNFDDIGIERFSKEMVRNQKLQDLCQKVIMQPSEHWPAGDEPEVEILLKDGRVLSEQVAIAYGDPDNPMSQEAVVTKFTGLVKDYLPFEDQRVLIDYGLSQHQNLREALDILARKRTLR